MSAVVVASGLLLSGLPALYFLAVYGCGEEEDRLAEVMAGEKVLDAVPEGAGRKERYRECDDDDRFVVVGTRYRYGGSPGSTSRHYAQVARADGWRPRTTAGGETVSGCFTKRVGGTTAYLDAGEPDGGFVQVEIVADRANSPGC
ncbi:hypothetical protein [Streptomyces sp. enrichment culture]|uniref:hypothetical protein n=1 Tax=Streptomyces sp. enrichment culture TaxID=1795815 RepID=UPI003F57DEC5